ncbi:hypothetical protein JOF41_006365 [Saccharothrix coeruleofusca]|uniref:hypothetical protein n=1 Tax=Saccharothrix coeruleofusca TaxID=33919 RepID=UPI001AE54804|nr:hypothetical protein [Saccharothrix coeruleofusca]MBP2340187.1 hypothetical protein [Saccharothrix coeruleofusca]
MDRRRIAALAAGAVLFTGVVAVLRGTGADTPATTSGTSAPPPTSLAPFAAEGVLLPTAGTPPQPPREVRVEAGGQRLRVRWSGDAPGYEVRWGAGEELDRTRLVGLSSVQLDGLENGVAHRVEVRAVDAFGLRSEPVRASGTPREEPLDDYWLVERFDQPTAPDPTRWRVAAAPGCARTGPGAGDDGRRLVISSSCAAAAVTLRSRTPFALHDAEVLGRFAAETDAPGADGELSVDLVPGPVTSVSGEALPPDALRVRVATGGSGTSVDVLVPEGASTRALRELPALEPGITHRWEVVLRRDGVRVLLDGEAVAESPVVPRWREATALLSVSGPTGQRVHVDRVAFDSARAEAPPTVVPPRLVVVGEQPDTADTEPVDGVAGGQLRLTLLHFEEPTTPPELTALVAGASVPLRPAVPGTPWRPDTGYPLVADLPADLLRQKAGGALEVAVPTPFRSRPTHLDLELTPAPGARPATAPPVDPLPPAETAPARVVGAVLDAAGQPVSGGTPVRPGRLVLDLALDGTAGQRATGVAGLAGFTLWLDGDRVAAVPTDADGPGVAGRYRLALNTGGLAEGPHMIEVRLFGSSGETRPTSAFVPFFIGR